MAATHDDFEKGVMVGDADSGSDKVNSHQIDHVGKDSAIAAEVTQGTTRRRQAPEFIRNMTPEVRQATELRLRKKLDLRIMPMIVLMYIMNYLDRVSISQWRDVPCTDSCVEQYRRR